MFKNRLLKQSLMTTGLLACVLPGLAQRKTIDQRVDSVLRLMTLEEKVGQLNQYSGDWISTGPITNDGDKQDQIRKGQIGSMLNIMGVRHTRQLQEMAMQSRLRIKPHFPFRWQKPPAGIWMLYNWQHVWQPQKLPLPVFTGLLHRWSTSPATHAGVG
jgi:hypothetical protein